LKGKINIVLTSFLLLLISQIFFVILVILSLMHSNYYEFSIGIGFEFIVSSIILQIYLYGVEVYES